ncbi:MAG: hypothetical protein R3C05_15255 [Pirellulaceae bacterium]
MPTITGAFHASFLQGKPHAWQYNNKDFQNNPVSLQRVATEVSGVDDGVGRIMATLEELGSTTTHWLFTPPVSWAGRHGGLFGMGTTRDRPWSLTQ